MVSFTYFLLCPFSQIGACLFGDGWGWGLSVLSTFGEKKLEMWSLERGSGNKWGDFSFLKIVLCSHFSKRRKEGNPIFLSECFCVFVNRWAELSCCVCPSLHHPQMFIPEVNLFTTPPEAIRYFDDWVSKRAGCCSVLLSWCLSGKHEEMNRTWE